MPANPPQWAGSSIPFIGHLVGLLQPGIGYFGILAEKHPYPIFSLDLILSKIYLAIQRNNKTITFDPFITFTAERIAGIHGSSLNLLREKRAGGHGLNQAVVHAMHPTLTGRSLDRMNERMARRLCPLIDELAHCKTVDLYACTDASYGPLNPYQDRKIADAFWAFETHLSPVLANFLPWITARTAWKGRETAVAALVKYFERHGHQGGSELTQVRWRTMHEAGLPVEDIARAEVSMALGLLSNTAPASFWILYDLYSRPALLQEIRREIQAHALREILRTRSTTAPTRIATQDVLVADKYLLQAGAVINMPGPSLGRHNDSETNNPRRTGGFMAFGVSPVICPGRHFASAEILGTVAMVVLRFDLVPVEGVWPVPRTHSMAIASIMCPLKDPFNMRVSPRQEYDGVRWDCEVREGTGGFNLMVG
ncbi:hypothetical protein P175DRAFT_0508222 [Aspergillus ochraceoroseus IBT 24754]|uniref:Cytochrome P450 n=1 Tax=Aspergillus ochraceoroseus IBT 24754 TaxID=1392256 RepID=A0A2T5M4X8_9EURO|nr:uncharacterized protein P175DRAFT_0508222 [Aspergillus ochraceoroseus IBT 24754]PTU23556.1 hypothetical protein P175DRAFT_0508222 [Aspergillus ochraceoroseus IBT 24754]